MAKKAQPQDAALQRAAQDILESRMRATGAQSKANPAKVAPIQFCRFLTNDSSAVLTLDTLLRATAADVDEFLRSLKPWVRTPYRSALVLFYDHLVEHGHAVSSIMDDAIKWPTVRRPPAAPKMSVDRWKAILNVFEEPNLKISDWSRAGYVMFLVLCRNMNITPAEVGRITVGMTRHGVVRLTDWRTSMTQSIAIDPESAAAISRYLSLLPIELADQDRLIRQSEKLGPANVRFVFSEIKVLAARAGLPFTSKEIPLKRLHWSASDDGALGGLFRSFRQMHPRFSPVSGGCR